MRFDNRPLGHELMLGDIGDNVWVRMLILIDTHMALQHWSKFLNTLTLVLSLHC